jgi:tetratricopeptide (TPR) repeat protein
VGKVFLFLMVFTPAWLAPALAAAQPDRATQDAARTLGRAGLELYDKGRWAAALEKFSRAYALYKAPTLGLMAARCEERLGRLAAAEQLYRDVMEIELDRTASVAFRDAKASAVREHGALLPRVPKLSLMLEPRDGAQGDGGPLALPGAPMPAASVTIDGAPVPAGALEKPQLLEVGSHKIEAVRGSARVVEGVTLREGDHRRLVLRLDPERPAEARAVVNKDATEPQSPGGLQRGLGFAAIGAGAAGLTAGAILAGLAAAKRGDLDDGGCADTVCPTSLQDDVDAYNTLRTGSGIGLITGAVVLAAGGILLWTAPSSRAPGDTGARVRIAPSVGWWSIGMTGEF